MALLGLGSGYFLWGGRAARLTESLNAMTLEMDTMRERLAHPQEQAGGGPAQAADELRVINEAIASFRQEIAEQKAMIQQNAAAAVPADAAAAQSALRSVRDELAACIADKQDLEAGRAVTVRPVVPQGAAPVAPAYRPPVPANPTPPVGTPPIGNDLSDPRF